MHNFLVDGISNDTELAKSNIFDLKYSPKDVFEIPITNDNKSSSQLFKIDNEKSTNNIYINNSNQDLLNDETENQTRETTTVEAEESINETDKSTDGSIETLVTCQYELLLICTNTFTVADSVSKSDFTIKNVGYRNRKYINDSST